MDFSITGERVIRVLSRLADQRGLPVPQDRTEQKRVARFKAWRPFSKLVAL
jgi:hypothetical protein